MKTNIKKILILSLIGAFSTIGFFGCSRNPLGIKGSNGIGKKAIDNESGIKEFYYSYGNSMGSGSLEYTVKYENEIPTFFYSSRDYRKYGEMKTPVDSDFMNKLENIYKEYRIAEWDGYHKTATNVLDGDGFSLSISFNDNNSMQASGSNCSPDRYGEFLTALNELFKPYVDKLLEEGRQAVISEGVSGNITSLIANFIQQGSSGSNNYKIILYSPEISKSNFDITISDKTGEFFEPGDYRYYASLPVEALQLDKINDLIQKYNVINWYGFDESDEDYNNCEWFQIDFSYENGDISAMGTKHPENYQEFRSEFLTLIKEIIDNAKVNYGLTEYK